MTIPEVPTPVSAAGTVPLASAAADAEREQQLAAVGAAQSGADGTDVPVSHDEQPPVSGRWIFLLAIGLFGAYVAYVTPIAISLAIQVEALSPGRPGNLGLLLGIGSAAALLVGPLGGQLSDRTRTRFGRRRPWMAAGIVVGVAGLAVMGSASSIFVLGIGWVIAQIGLSQTVNNITTLQADRLPEAQRGRVAGLTGFVTMVAPVAGAVVGGALATQPLLLFLVPGAIGFVLVGLSALLIGEPDARALPASPALTSAQLLGKYVFDPRRYHDFSWNWLGRFMFFTGLTLNTSYTAYFFASRLSLPVAEIGGTVALVGGIGVLGTIVGALGSGFLSDRLGQRKVFVLGGAALFSLGSLVMVIADGIPLLVVGAVLGNLGIGIFAAVDQALFLDVLPDKATDAGRFINLTQFATTIPQALAPVAGAGVLALSASSAEPSYSLLYVLAAVLTLLGGLAVLKVKAVR